MIQKNKKKHNKEDLDKEKKIIKKNNKNKVNGIDKTKKKKTGKVVKIILIILLLMLIVIGTIIFKRVKENGGGVQGIVATILGHDASTLENLPELQFLIIGQSQNLTDTIMLCSYNPRTQKASILSIPRDTYIGKNKARAVAYEKINALYQDSPEKLLKKINELTGLNIKYYINVDTEALVDLVDAIGGVEFDVPIDMNYDDGSQELYIHLKAGTQLLDGDKAEQLVRFRHNNNGTTYPIEYGQEDIGRMRTQREFIKAIINKVVKVENINKADNFIAIAKKYIKTNMEIGSFKDYAPYVVSFDVNNVRTETLPGVPEKCNGLWFYMCNVKQTQELAKDMFTLDLVDDVTITDVEDNSQIFGTSDVNVKGIKIEILNGTSDVKKLTELKTIMYNMGFIVSKTGTTSKTNKTTIINRTGKSNEIANKIKSTVGAGIISIGNNNAGVDFTIVIGSDF